MWSVEQSHWISHLARLSDGLISSRSSLVLVEEKLILSSLVIDKKRRMNCICFCLPSIELGNILDFCFLVKTQLKSCEPCPSRFTRTHSITSRNLIPTCPRLPRTPSLPSQWKSLLNRYWPHPARPLLMSRRTPSVGSRVFPIGSTLQPRRHAPATILAVPV